MIVPDWLRLVLYCTMSVLPVWIDFFTKSTDYSLRGLAMPTLSSLLAAVTVTLARTRGSHDNPPSDP
jgi:hypothetical protein